MYLDLLDGHKRYLRKYIWKIKVPMKIKIFMWFLHRKVILTKENLVKGIGMEINRVVFMIKKNLFNTFSLIAPYPN